MQCFFIYAAKFPVYQRVYVKMAEEMWRFKKVTMIIKGRRFLCAYFASQKDKACGVDEQQIGQWLFVT